jgi:ATP-dependent Clp protease ATP-binding subunit ClpB
MNFNKFTLKSQEAIQNAQEIASSYNNQLLEPEHLLAALVQDSSGTVVPILQKVGANLNFIKIKLNEFIERLPKVSGAGLGSQSISQPLGRLLEDASRQARELKDDYVSTEHLLLAIASTSDSTAGKLLNDQGVTKDSVYKVLKEIRGTQRVTDQNPEDKYQALERYGRDLNALARRGKMDPVIGRDEEIRGWARPPLPRESPTGLYRETSRKLSGTSASSLSTWERLWPVQAFGDSSRKGSRLF